MRCSMIKYPQSLLQTPKLLKITVHQQYHCIISKQKYLMINYVNQLDHSIKCYA